MEIKGRGSDAFELSGEEDVGPPREEEEGPWRKAFPTGNKDSSSRKSKEETRCRQMCVVLKPNTNKCPIQTPLPFHKDGGI